MLAERLFSDGKIKNDVSIIDTDDVGLTQKTEEKSSSG
jgi:hypothetical protein